MDEVEKTWRGMGSEKLEKKLQRRMRSGREMGEEGGEGIIEMSGHTAFYLSS